MLQSLRKRRPAPTGTATEPDHRALAEVLAAVQVEGVAGLPERRPNLDSYITELAGVDPDSLSRNGALAYWLNLYNAGALHLAGDALAASETSVLRVPGGFSRPIVSVGDEGLSLSDIEHGKVRRFKDPRIHSALVCGSASCPTLRFEPYQGLTLESQLDAQTRSFLAAGAAARRDDTLQLSRVFLWYGADFVRPSRMPTFRPATRRQIGRALRPWLSPELRADAGKLKVVFQPYDWGLACSITLPD
ncbi:MAG: DUF547 domain-containing protein [Acidimicrobiia bacterium]|nr:DUF547 domain-containing protein [Acidimicrobiia bacterium]